ncbi:MAG: type III pantothenate kinase, partial [Planctomycetota bacterium]
ESLLGRAVALVGRDLPLPVENLTAHPEESGDDRLCAALAAHDRAGGPAVSVGCGTAITVDAVDGQGRFLGGAIAPGVRPALDGLVAAAPLLPAVDPADEPAAFPAGGTAEAMRVAVRRGFAGMVDRLVAEAREALGDADAPVFIAGGDGALLTPHLRCGGISEAPYLVAEGVRIAWQRRG